MSALEDRVRRILGECIDSVLPWKGALGEREEVIDQYTAQILDNREIVEQILADAQELVEQFRREESASERGLARVKVEVAAREWAEWIEPARNMFGLDEPAQNLYDAVKVLDQLRRG